MSLNLRFLKLSLNLPNLKSRLNLPVPILLLQEVLVYICRQPNEEQTPSWDWEG